MPRTTVKSDEVEDVLTRIRLIRTRLVISSALLLVAGLIVFAGVPYVCRLQDGFASSQRLVGTYQVLDPATFDLGEPTEIDAHRETTVDSATQSTALVTSTTVVNLPSGAQSTKYSYAVNRYDYGQIRPPKGGDVLNQRGGMVISRPTASGAGDFKVYNPAIDSTQPMTYTGSSQIGGRAVNNFTGTASGVLADRQLAAPYEAAIGVLANTGDGTTIPKLLLEMIVADLPLRYAGRLAAILPALPNEVSVKLTVVDTTSLALDQQIGAPITLSGDQTTILNVFDDFTLTPVMPLSRIALHSDADSTAASAQYMSDNGRKLTMFGTYLPIGLTAAALALAISVAVSVVRFRRSSTPVASATAASDPDPGDRHTTRYTRAGAALP
ncbi:porin PorA family protein [Nocardia sp. NPDC057663]|uniref:porin PorA family protein n=1 Tax=Nocardia sp. NPDC057663 TaxID=3346201 RepID=UPI003671DC78